MTVVAGTEGVRAELVEAIRTLFHPALSTQPGAVFLALALTGAAVDSGNLGLLG